MANVIEMKSKFVPMPEGANPAIIAEIQDKPDQDIAPQYVAANKQQAIKEGRDPNTVATKVNKVVFVYKDAEGREAAEWFTKSLGAKANLFKRVSGLLGHAPASPFDLDSLLNLPVTVITESGTNAKGYATAKVVAVTKRKGAGSAPAPAAPVVAKANVHGVEVTDDDLGF